MTAEWTTSRLEELSINLDRMRRPIKESDRRPGPYPYYGASGVVDHVDDFIFDGEYLLVAEDGENLRTRQTPIAFLARGKFWVNNHAHIIAGNDRADTRFLLYALRHVDIDAYLTGAVMPKLTQGNLNRIEVSHPLLPEQRAIAGVLGALDDKIEQNRQTARALERLARAIFRAWFVDFEPVKVKAEGATAFPSMPQPVFDALPTRFADSSIGPVPEGWGPPRRVADLEQRRALVIGDGYRAKRSELADQGLPFIRARNVDETVITEGAELLGVEAVSKVGIKRSQVWDTVFTSKGTVGRLALVTPGTGDVVYAPQVCFWRAVDRETLSPYYLYLWMRSEMFTKQWMAVKGETDMADFVSLSDQRAMNFFVPPLDVQRAFDQMVQPLIELRAHVESESRKLAETRDLLLPKLLSGQVRVEATHG